MYVVLNDGNIFFTQRKRWFYFAANYSHMANSVPWLTLAEFQKSSHKALRSMEYSKGYILSSMTFVNYLWTIRFNVTTNFGALCNTNDIRIHSSIVYPERATYVRSSYISSYAILLDVIAILFTRVLQIMKFSNNNCCKAKRSSLFEFLKENGLPSPVSFDKTTH